MSCTVTGGWKALISQARRQHLQQTGSRILFHPTPVNSPPSGLRRLCEFEKLKRNALITDQGTFCCNERRRRPAGGLRSPARAIRAVLFEFDLSSTSSQKEPEEVRNMNPDKWLAPARFRANSREQSGFTCHCSLVVIDYSFVHAKRLGSRGCRCRSRIRDS